jgi:hypothetical protein
MSGFSKTNNSNLNTSINYQLHVKEMDYLRLLEDYNSLRDKYVNLEKEFLDLKRTHNNFLKNEKNSKSLLDSIETLEKENSKLKLEIDKIKKSYEDQIKSLNFEKQKEIDNFRNHIDTISVKIESASSIERASQCQMAMILELEENIRKLEISKQNDLNKNKVNFDTQLRNMKEKMMGKIKETRKSVAEFNMRNMDVSTKLTMLQNSQLLIELEYQSYQIEDLLKKKDVNEKQILELKKDLEICRDVQNVLTEKNKKFTDIIRRLSYENSRLKENTNQNNQPSVDSTSSEKQLKTNLSPTNLSPINLNVNTNIREQNYLSYISKSKKKNELIKTLKLKEIEFNTLKLKHESLSDKLSQYEKKMFGILKLFETGIEKLSEDPELKNNREIYVNVNDIKNIDFSNFTIEQKYTIIMLLIKHLIPLIDLTDIPKSDILKENLEKVKVKYQLKGAEKTPTLPSSLGFRTNYDKNASNCSDTNAYQFKFKRSLYLDGMNTTSTFRNTFSSGIKSDPAKKSNLTNYKYKII